MSARRVMLRSSFVVGMLLCCAGDVVAAAPDAKKLSDNWPQFRGVGARGIGRGTVPTKWNGETGENIKWKTRIPGLGLSCPIVWGNRVFVTTAVSESGDTDLRIGLYGDIAPVQDDSKHSWRVYCIGRTTGKILWEKEAFNGVPKIKRHTKASHANSTPATDGKHVLVSFGSEGLYCYSVGGKLLWKKDLGVLDAGYYRLPDAQWEFGSSPIIYKNMAIVQCDVQKKPFIAAYDIDSGEEIWRIARDEVCTWSTPTVHESNGRTQLIANGYKSIGAYDVKTGKPLWWFKGGGDIPVPTPFVAQDLIYITNAHGGAAPMYVIDPAATGKMTVDTAAKSNKYIAWSGGRKGCYLQTPLVYGDNLYVCQGNGVLSCFGAKTGKEVYRTRLGSGSSGFTASAVAADGKLFYSTEDGDIIVVSAGDRPNRLATNPMGEVCMATPAISRGNLFIRGKDHLFCVGP